MGVWEGFVGVWGFGVWAFQAERSFGTVGMIIRDSCIHKGLRGIWGLKDIGY